MPNIDHDNVCYTCFGTGLVSDVPDDYCMMCEPGCEHSDEFGEHKCEKCGGKGYLTPEPQKDRP